MFSLFQVRLAFIVLLTSLISWPAHASDAFLPAEQAFALTVEQVDGGTGDVRLHWKIAPGYYLYRDRIGIAAAPADSLDPVALPAGERKEDPNFGVMEVYHDAVTVPVHAPGAQALNVTWQGCADAGLCYPPQTRKVALHAAADGAASADASAAPASFANVTTASDSRVTELLGEHSLGWTLPLFFLLGIALAFTPCVLPMVPIVSCIVVGSQAPPRRAFALSLAFVLSMALTYALLGGAAAMLGANLQALLQNRWTVMAFGAVFALLAMVMFGFFTLQLPPFLRDRIDAVSRRRQGGTLAGAAALGLLSALLVGPCMTAPLAGTLLYIAQTGNVVAGSSLLFALGLGMGLPLLVIGTVGARYLPKPGAWMERVKGLLGFLMLGTAIWMVQRMVPASLALWGALLAGLALTFAHLASQAGAGGRLFGRSMALVAGLWASAMVLGAAAGGSDPWRPLASFAVSAGSASGGDVSGVSSTAPSLPFDTIHSPQMLQARLAAARTNGQPVLVDFSAEWCVSCHTIEREVFGDPRVRQGLAGVMLLRADVTAGDAEQRALMRDHHVLGPPTVMLFDAQGRERRDARLVGEFGVADLLQRQHSAPSTLGSPS